MPISVKTQADGSGTCVPKATLSMISASADAMSARLLLLRLNRLMPMRDASVLSMTPPSTDLVTLMRER